MLVPKHARLEINDDSIIHKLSLKTKRFVSCGKREMKNIHSHFFLSLLPFLSPFLFLFFSLFSLFSSLRINRMEKQSFFYGFCVRRRWFTVAVLKSSRSVRLRNETRGFLLLTHLLYSNETQTRSWEGDHESGWAVCYVRIASYSDGVSQRQSNRTPFRSIVNIGQSLFWVRIKSRGWKTSKLNETESTSTRSILLLLSFLFFCASPRSYFGWKEALFDPSLLGSLIAFWFVVVGQLTTPPENDASSAIRMWHTTFPLSRA